MNFKFYLHSTLVLPLSLFCFTGGAEAATYSAPVEQPQQQLIAQALYNQGSGEWREEGVG